MSELFYLQDQFQYYLLKEKNKMTEEVVSTKKVSAKKRLDIYGNAYRSRLVEALSNNYPVLKQYVGDDLFQKMSLAYIKKYPSTFKSIRWFGDQLSAFLKNKFLSELALFEWTMTLAFDAENNSVLTIEEMGAIPPEKWIHMKLHTHASLHRINLSWNVVAIWQAIVDQHALPEKAKSRHPIPWIIWRQGLNNYFCSLSPDEAWGLDAVLKNATFGEICEGLCQFIPEDEAGLHAASFLKRWISAEMIKSIEV